MNIKDIINKKEKGKSITQAEFKYVIDNYVDEKITDEQMSKLLILICKKSLSFKETYYLTDAMINSGEIINFSNINKEIVDKHSTGGIGDKISLIVAPIVASLGIGVAKMSGRGLGFTGGTIDKLESITGYRVNLSKEEMINQVNDIGVSIISQNDKVAIADKKIYALRNEINAVNSIPLIASSIMSKKIASGSDNIVIDMKVGRGAFMKSISEAKILAKCMIKLGKLYSKKVIVVLSDMNTPLGYSIGNTLEVKEVIDFFDGKCEKRLKEVVIKISSYMIYLSTGKSLKESEKLVFESLENGAARSKFYEWIRYQNGDINNLKDNSKKFDIFSNTSGYINYIDAIKIGNLSCALGTGRKTKESKIDYAVGIKLNKTLGDYIRKDELLGTIYYNDKVQGMEKIFNNCFEIGNKKKRKKRVILGIIK